VRHPPRVELIKVGSLGFSSDQRERRGLLIGPRGGDGGETGGPQARVIA
jgi:hypothetical protein